MNSKSRSRIPLAYALRWMGEKISQLLLPLASVLGALLIGGILMLLVGINPFTAYSYLWTGIAGSSYQVGTVLVKATPLLLTGLGMGLALRCGVFNIGGEGQIYIGALAGTAVGIYFGGLPPIVHVILSILAGFLAGGLWAAVPGLLKARFHVNEVISTILLNYIGIYLVSYFTHGPMRANPDSSASLPYTAEVLGSSRLPIIFPGTRLHAGFLIAIVIAVLMYVIIFRTPFGFKARAVGFNPEAANYSGMKVVSVIVLAMLISGGLAGIAGTVEILGVQRRLRDGFSSGIGYTAIAIALLGRNNPIGITLASILFGALEVGIANMEALAGVPVTLVDVIQGLTIFFVAIGAVTRTDFGKQLFVRLFPNRKGV